MASFPLRLLGRKVKNVRVCSRFTVLPRSKVLDGDRCQYQPSLNVSSAGRDRFEMLTKKPLVAPTPKVHNSMRRYAFHNEKLGCIL